MFFKKKKPVEQPKPLLIKSRTEKFNVGKATAKIKLETGEEITCVFYGYVDQCVPRYGLPDKPVIMSARSHVLNHMQSRQDYYYDDFRNPMSIHLGRAVSAQIISLEDYEKEFEVKYVEEE